MNTKQEQNGHHLGQLLVHMMLFRKYDKNDDTDTDTIIYSSVHKKS